MRRVVLLVVSIIFLIVLVSVILLIVNIPFSADKSFYVGVTYCGDTVGGAKHLIDKVKDYTNIFILISGKLQYDLTAIEEVGDYAIASGLNFNLFWL